MFFNTDAADAYYLRPSSTPCYDVSADVRSASLSSSRVGGGVRPRRSGGGGALAADETDYYYYYGACNGKAVTRPVPPQRPPPQFYRYHEGNIDMEDVSYHALNPHPRASPASTALPDAAAAHIPTTHRRTSAPPSVTGSGVWERADYLPRPSRPSSALVPPPPSSLATHSGDAYAAVAGTSSLIAGGVGPRLPPPRPGARPHQRPASAPSSASPAAVAVVHTASRHDRSGESRGLYVLPPPAPPAPAASDAGVQRLRMLAPAAAAAAAATTAYALPRYSAEDLAAARRSAAAAAAAAAAMGSSSSSGAAPQTAVSRVPPPVPPPAPSAAHRHVVAAPAATAPSAPTRPTRWTADAPSPTRTGSGASAAVTRHAAAQVVPSPERPASHRKPSPVGEEPGHRATGSSGSRSGSPAEADVGARDSDGDDSAASVPTSWWTVDIVAAPATGNHDCTLAEVSSLVGSPADMRVVRSMQCRAPVLPADASAEEAWDMTQSFLRCIALTSAGARASPPCTPRWYFYFDTDFNQYVELTADTLPLASTLFRVVMAEAATTRAEDRPRQPHAVASATATEDPLLASATGIDLHHQSAHVSPAHDRDATARVHLRSAAPAAPHPPGSRPTSAARPTPRSAAPARGRDEAAAPPPLRTGAVSSATWVGHDVDTRRDYSDDYGDDEEGDDDHQYDYHHNHHHHHHRHATSAAEEALHYPRRPRWSDEQAAPPPTARRRLSGPRTLPTHDADISPDSTAEEELRRALRAATARNGGEYGAYPHHLDEAGSEADDEDYDEAYQRRSPSPAAYRGAGSGYAAAAAAWEAPRGAVGDRYGAGEDEERYIDHGGAPIDADAEEVIHEAVLRAAKAAERQLRASYAGIGGRPDETHRVQRYRAVPLNARPPMHPPPTRPPPPATPSRHVNGDRTPPQPFFDDPVLQRHCESPFTQSTPSPHRAPSGGAESHSSTRFRLYARSAHHTAPVAPPPPPPPPSPPSLPAPGVYRPVAHPYFDPAAAAAAMRHASHVAESTTAAAAMERVKSDALTALLQRSALARQQAHAVPAHPPPHPPPLPLAIEHEDSTTADSSGSGAPVAAASPPTPQPTTPPALSSSLSSSSSSSSPPRLDEPEETNAVAAEEPVDDEPECAAQEVDGRAAADLAPHPAEGPETAMRQGRAEVEVEEEEVEEEDAPPPPGTADDAAAVAALPVSCEEAEEAAVAAVVSPCATASAEDSGATDLPEADAGVTARSAEESAIAVVDDEVCPAAEGSAAVAPAEAAVPVAEESSGGGAGALVSSSHEATAPQPTLVVDESDEAAHDGSAGVQPTTSSDPPAPLTPAHDGSRLSDTHEDVEADATADAPDVASDAATAEEVERAPPAAEEQGQEVEESVQLVLSATAEEAPAAPAAVPSPTSTPLCAPAAVQHSVDDAAAQVPPADTGVSVAVDEAAADSVSSDAVPTEETSTHPPHSPTPDAAAHDTSGRDDDDDEKAPPPVVCADVTAASDGEESAGADAAGLQTVECEDAALHAVYEFSGSAAAVDASRAIDDSGEEPLLHSHCDMDAGAEELSTCPSAAEHAGEEDNDPENVTVDVTPANSVDCAHADSLVMQGLSEVVAVASASDVPPRAPSADATHEVDVSGEEERAEPVPQDARSDGAASEDRTHEGTPDAGAPHEDAPRDEESPEVTPHAADLETDAPDVSTPHDEEPPEVSAHAEAPEADAPGADTPHEEVPLTDEPSAEAPHADAPEVDAPDVDTPHEDAQHDEESPEVSAHAEAPDADVLDVSAPHDEELPEVSEHAGAPEADVLDVDTPHEDTPHDEEPPEVSAHAEAPEADAPGADTPHEEVPLTDEPSAEAPHADAPEADVLDVDTPHEDTPLDKELSEVSAHAEAPDADVPHDDTPHEEACEREELRADDSQDVAGHGRTGVEGAVDDGAAPEAAASTELCESDARPLPRPLTDMVAAAGDGGVVALRAPERTGLGTGTELGCPLQPDHGEEATAAAEVEGTDEALSGTATPGTQAQECSDGSSPLQGLDIDGDEDSAAVTARVRATDGQDEEEEPSSAATDANTQAPQPDVVMTAMAAGAATGGEPASLSVAAAAEFLPAPVIAVATEKEKQEDPDAPPQVLHHRAAAAAAAAAANAFYSLWEESVTEDGTDGEDGAKAAEEHGDDSQHRGAMSEATTSATTATQNDDDAAVDVPMDVFRDSLSLTHTPTLTRRGEGRDEDTSVAATGSLADPADMLAHTTGSDLRPPQAPRRVLPGANRDGGASMAGGSVADVLVPTITTVAVASGECATEEVSVTGAATTLEPQPQEWHGSPLAGAAAAAAACRRPGDDAPGLSSSAALARPLPAEVHRGNSVLPLLDVSADGDGDGAATVKTPTTTPASELGADDAPREPYSPATMGTSSALPLPVTPQQALHLYTPVTPPSPPRNDGAMKKTMVLLGFPGSAWEFIMTHHYEPMHDAFASDAAVAVNVPVSAIQDVRYSKGSLMVDLYVLHPASVGETFIRDQMSNYSYPTLWALYEVKKRERKQLLHGHGASVAGAMSVQSMPPPPTPALSSQEEVGWAAS
ncbi:hypothetical protein NESM_000348800 [Novymonas esmeraldas]|uniref:Flagellar attachment zone protein 1 conserved domain-containing protein n=1 Tax=Novymonas esmeraldas TaxID=1808958 RepID=A0AAW0EME8_9TRYP